MLATENINNGTVILERDTEKDEDSGFIKITGDGNYYFFFYYPCITEALITADYINATEAYNNDNSIPFYTLLSYPHWYTGTTSTTDRSQYTLCETPANSGLTTKHRKKLLTTVISFGAYRPQTVQAG